MGSQALEQRQAGRSEQPSAGGCSKTACPEEPRQSRGLRGNEAGETAGLPYLAALGWFVFLILLK